MTINSPDSWYNDERTKYYGGYTIAPGNVWNYGIEKFCNMEGRYLHIVADLSHLIGVYKMSVCAVASFGTAYIRDESLPDSLELVQGESISLSVPHIYTEYDSGMPH